jgi:hypothetical protein
MLIDLRRVRGVSMGDMGAPLTAAGAAEAARHFTRPDGTAGTCAAGTYYDNARKWCAPLVGGRVPASGLTLAVSTNCGAGQLFDPVTKKCKQVGATAVADTKKAEATWVAGNSAALSTTATKIAAADPTNAAKAANAAAAASAAAAAAHAAAQASNARAQINTQAAAAVVALATASGALPPVPPATPPPTPAAVLPPVALVTTTSLMPAGTPSMNPYGGGGGGGGGADWGDPDVSSGTAPAVPPQGFLGLTPTQLALGAAALAVVGYVMFKKGGSAKTTAG